nr:MAG TPA: hypothetical protein [Caudoviricetes sp.]
MGRIWPHPPSRAITRQRMRRHSYGRDERGSSHVPIRAKRSTLDSHTLPLSRNKTVGGRPNRLLGRNKAIRPRDRARSRPLRQRPPNRKTPNNRPAPLTPPQQTADHPEHTIERSKHNSQTNTEENNTRIDDAPLHHEAHGTSASATTTRKPMPGHHATRVIERARKRNTVAESHFRSDLSG